MDVAIHYHRSADGAAETASMARDRGAKAEVFSADLGGGASVCESLIEAVQQSLGTPRVLVNNASVFDSGTLADLDEAAWEHTMRVNLAAPAFLSKAVAGRLGEQRGHLIQLVDWRADNPIPGHLAYTISKAGLAAMTRLLAQELGPTIQVNGIAPGAILPPPGRSVDYLDQVAERLPLRRAGSPQEIVNAVEFLLQADFVTGDILHITGGQQLGAH